MNLLIACFLSETGEDSDEAIGVYVVGWLVCFADAKEQAGASAEDALRSIIISEQLLGTTEIVLVKHTGCGMLTFQNRDAYRIVRENLG